MNNRCAPLTFLDLATREREWKGVPSVTQLIDGTRRQYLLITTDYAVNPQKAAYRVLGTRGHTALDTDNDFSFTEEHFDDGDIQGTADMVEQQENGEWWMIDHKTTGSYKVAKALGIVKKEEIQYGEDGAPLKHKNGKVVKKRWFERSGEPDMEDWIMQLNMYRIKFEEMLKEKIYRIKIFCITRDGNTFSAKNRGVVNEFEYIDVPRRDDVEVLAFYDKKRKALLKAFDTGTVPPECTPVECWDGNKCKLCEVAEECAKHGRSYIIPEEDDE